MAKLQLIDILCHICAMYFSSTILSDFCEYAALNGLDTTKLMLEVQQLQQNKYITYEAMVGILTDIDKRLDDEHLGLHIGEQIALKVTSHVDSIMEYSDTLESAFENAVVYSRLISDALDCTLHKANDFYTVVFEENPNWKVQQRQAKKHILDLTLLSCLKSLAAYTEQRYYPVKINFETPKPKHLNEYFRLYNCRMHFNQPKTEIVFSKQLFDKHSKKVKRGLLEGLKEKVEVEMNNLTIENPLIYELKKLILKHKPERILIEVASQRLNLSKRTLQRKLRQLNTSFKEIEYELQIRLAKTYLEEMQTTIEEMSYLLGFSESSAFIRFFKALTGKTPMEYRRSIFECDLKNDSLKVEAV